MHSNLLAPRALDHTAGGNVAVYRVTRAGKEKTVTAMRSAVTSSRPGFPTTPRSVRIDLDPPDGR
jgi:hypothetical protein